MPAFDSTFLANHAEHTLYPYLAEGGAALGVGTYTLVWHRRLIGEAAGSGVEVTPSPVALEFSVPAPSVSHEASYGVTPSPVVAQFSVPAPAVSHEASYADISTPWNREFAAGRTELEALIQTSRDPSSQLRAKRAIETLNDARIYHNPGYSIEVLRWFLQDLRSRQ